MASGLTLEIVSLRDSSNAIFNPLDHGLTILFFITLTLFFTGIGINLKIKRKRESCSSLCD